MGRGGDALKVELSELMIIAGHLTLAFEDLDEDTWLVVSVGGEGLLLLGGNACVSWDKNSHDTAGGLDTLGEGCDIEEEEVLDLLATLSGEDGSLNGSAVSDSLIGVEGSEVCTRKVRILDVSYNASNNELLRTKTLVKNCVVLVDATPFRQWYETHYGVKIGMKKGSS